LVLCARSHITHISQSIAAAPSTGKATTSHSRSTPVRAPMFGLILCEYCMPGEAALPPALAATPIGGYACVTTTLAAPSIGKATTSHPRSTLVRAPMFGLILCGYCTPGEAALSPALGATPIGGYACVTAPGRLTGKLGHLSDAVPLVRIYLWGMRAHLAQDIPPPDTSAEPSSRTWDGGLMGPAMDSSMVCK